MEGRVVTHQVESLRVVQPCEEESFQPPVVEVGLAAVGLVILPEGVEVIGLASEPQPTFPANEVYEQQAVEHSLRELLGVGLPDTGSYQPDGSIVGCLVVLEEGVGDRLDAEGVADGLAHGLAQLAVVAPHIGNLLDGGAGWLAMMGYQALQAGSAAGQVGVDDVQLIAVSAGEQQ